MSVPDLPMMCMSNYLHHQLHKESLGLTQNVMNSDFNFLWMQSYKVYDQLLSTVPCDNEHDTPEENRKSKSSSGNKKGVNRLFSAG